MTTLQIALYTSLACAVCVVLSLWSLTFGIVLAVILGFIVLAISGREFEGYL